MQKLICAVLGHDLKEVWRFERGVSRWRCHRCGLWEVGRDQEDVQWS